VLPRERFASGPESRGQRLGTEPRRLVLQDEATAALALGDTSAGRARFEMAIDGGVLIGLEFAIDVWSQELDRAPTVAHGHLATGRGLP
jgi:hypothetical protein